MFHEQKCNVKFPNMKILVYIIVCISDFVLFTILFEVIFSTFRSEFEHCLVYKMTFFKSNAAYFIIRNVILYLEIYRNMFHDSYET